MQQLVSGNRVWIQLPFGQFLLDPTLSEPSILVAGGTGIAPFASYLQARLEQGTSDVPVSLLYGVASVEHLVFDQLLSLAAAQFLELRLFAESGPLNRYTHPVQPGRLCVDDVVRTALLHPSAHIYVAGPQAMVNAVSTALSQASIAEHRVHFDQWE